MPKLVIQILQLPGCCYQVVKGRRVIQLICLNRKTLPSGGKPLIHCDEWNFLSGDILPSGKTTGESEGELILSGVWR